MLVSHINAIEKILLAQSAAAWNAGRPNLRGGPREWFIRDFLEDHLPSNLEIGQGEIIDQDSRPNPPPAEYRPQVDIVLYRRDLPKITYSRDNNAYLAEGVLATIETKSALDKGELEKACNASSIHKSLIRNHPIYIPENFNYSDIISYVIAYDCPSTVSTVASWLKKISRDTNTPIEKMVNMIIILGKGTILRRDMAKYIIPETPLSAQDRWIYFENDEKNLFALFAHMMQIVSYFTSPPDTAGYSLQFSFEEFKTI
jgi:hypothetical protein